MDENIENCADVVLDSELTEGEVVGLSTSTSSKSKKKPKKRRKKPTTLPSLAPLEPHLVWKTKHTQVLGRHAVAKEEIPSGTRVLVEEAVVALPRERFAASICHHCLKTLSDFQRFESQTSAFGSVFCDEKCLAASEMSDPSLKVLFEQLPQISSQFGCDLQLLQLIIKLCVLKSKQPAAESNEETEKKVQGVWWKSEDSFEKIKCCWKDVLSLMRNWDKMSEEWKTSITGSCKAMRDLLKEQGIQTLDLDLNEMQFLAAMINTNIHGLGAIGSENTDLALGLFPVLSMFNHSCDPNCCFASTGTVMVVRTLRKIAPDEALTVSYINLMDPRWLRQRILSENRFFNCGCCRCLEEKSNSSDRLLEGIGCPIENCPGLMVCGIDSDSTAVQWKCLECNEQCVSSVALPSDQLLQPQPCGGCCQELQCIRQVNLEEIKKMKTEPDRKFDPGVVLKAAQENLSRAMELCAKRQIPQATHLLEQHIVVFEEMLNPHHLYVFDALTPLLNCYRSMENNKESIKTCQRILQSFEKILRTSALEVSNYQKILGELYQQRMFEMQNTNHNSGATKLMKKQAQEALRKCYTMRLVCCGKPHPKTTEIMDLLKSL